MRQYRYRASGFTLLEVTFAMAIGVTLTLIVTQIMVTSTVSVDYLSRSNVSDLGLKRALARMGEDFRESGTAVVTIDSTGTDWDAVTVQTADTSTDPVTWGTVDSDGVFRPNWQVEYLVVENDFVRRILNTGGVPVGPEATLIIGIDDLFDDGGGQGPQKGFIVEAVPGSRLFNVTIRLLATFRDNKQTRREVNTTFIVKN